VSEDRIPAPVRHSALGRMGCTEGVGRRDKRPSAPDVRAFKELDVFNNVENAKEYVRYQQQDHLAGHAGQSKRERECVCVCVCV
jgi:hypothetical protein